CAAPVPALERSFGLHRFRLRGRIDLQRLEPLDSGEPVPKLATRFRLGEVRKQPLDVVLRKAARAQPRDRLVSLHAGACFRPRDCASSRTHSALFSACRARKARPVYAPSRTSHTVPSAPSNPSSSAIASTISWSVADTM